MRKIKSIAFCALLLALVISSLFVFTSCKSEPTERVTITYEVRDDVVLITGYEGVLDGETVLEIPSEIEGKSVVAIADEAFRGKDDLKRIILPTTIVAIGEGAFKSCENLVSVNIPSQVTEIKADTFYGCKSLKSVDIPEAVTAIGDDAFKRCNGIEELTAHGWALSFFDITSLKTLNIRGELEISFGMFSDCKKLEALTIPFVGSDIDASANTHFGYIFGAENYYENRSFVPSTLSKVVVTGGKIIDDGAFYGCQSLITVMLPRSVETIGANAFEGCTSLENVTIPALTKYIGPYAFSHTSLKNATIPSLVTTIEAYTFVNCDRLESVAIAEGVTKIMPNAFIGCNSLTSLDVSSLNQWLSFEFASCYDSPLYYAGNLYIKGKLQEEITIPEGTEKIPNNAFYRCSSIKKVNFNEELTEIGSYAFAGCVNLNNITFPEALTKIGTASFTNCTSIEALTIGENVKEIGEYAFNLTSSLKRLTFSADMTSLPDAIFRESALAEVVITSPITTVSNTAFDGSNRIKKISAPIAVLEKIRVKSSLTDITITGGEVITEELFKGLKNLECVTISSSVKTIEPRAFMDCKRLMSFNIPEDSALEAIGEEAFKSCYLLYSFVLPENISTLGNNAFIDCVRLVEITNLSSLNLEDSESMISFHSYNIRASLSDESIISINGEFGYIYTEGEYKLFAYLGRNSDVTLPEYYDEATEATYSIAGYALSHLDIRILSIPATVTGAADTSFTAMESLVDLEATGEIIKLVDRPTRERVTNLYVLSCDIIDYSILGNFTSLSHLRLGKDVKGVDPSATIYSDSLSSISVDKGNEGFKAIDGNLYEILTNGDKLVRACPGSTDYFTLPLTTVEIGDYAFFNCVMLNTLYIESGSVLSSIGNYAFYGASSIYSLELPGTLSYIGEDAFYGCLYLSDISFTSPSEKFYTAGGCLIDKTTNTLIRAFGEKGVVEIPNDISVTSIGNNAFAGQATIKKIVFPKFFTLAENVFYNLSALEEILVDAGNTEYKVVDGCLIEISTGTLVLGTKYAKIPADGSVKTIRNDAFRGNTAITSIVIPEAVTHIHGTALEHCESLTTVEIPLSLLDGLYLDYVTNLTITGSGNISQLSDYPLLESLTIGEGITSIEEGAFRLNTAISKIEVREGNKSLKAIDGALIDLTTGTVIALTPGAKIPSDGTATRIGAYAFANKENAGSLYIPDAITEIDETAFSDTTGLTSIAAPLRLLNLFEAEELISIEITGGSTLTDADLAPFPYLESLKLGKSVTSVVPGAFIHSGKLTSIEVASDSESYRAINGALIELETGKLILGVGNCTLPLDGTVKEVADYAFYNNTKITRLVIPTGVTSLGDNSLVGCTSLKELFVPAGANLAATGLVGEVTIYEYSEAKPQVEGRFWYIEDGKVKIWW